MTDLDTILNKPDFTLTVPVKNFAKEIGATTGTVKSWLHNWQFNNCVKGTKRDKFILLTFDKNSFENMQTYLRYKDLRNGRSDYYNKFRRMTYRMLALN